MLRIPRFLHAAAFAAVLSLGAACAPSAEAPSAGSAPAAATTGEAALETLVIETDRGPVRLNVEIADTPEERRQGLMFRESLADDHGMLFDFDPPEMASFWMRNTLISLDIIFIGPDGRILNIARRAAPYSLDPIPANGLTRGVLEIRGGRADELGIAPGDRVRHRIFPQG
jgi:hypothetical protein